MEDRDVGHGVGELDLDRDAQRRGAAHTRAVVDVVAPGADALDERDVLGLEVSGVDLGLGLDLGHDLGVLSVVVLGGLVGIIYQVLQQLQIVLEFADHPICLTK